MSKKTNCQFSCSRMMLPEHRAGLQQQAAGKQRAEKHRFPIMDEQRREELQRELEEALAGAKVLEITTLSERGYRFYRGLPVSADPATGLLRIKDTNGRRLTIKAGAIISLEQSRVD